MNELFSSRIVHCSNGLDREFFLAPDGGSYSGIFMARKILFLCAKTPLQISFSRVRLYVRYNDLFSSYRLSEHLFLLESHSFDLFGPVALIFLAVIES